MVDNKRRYNQVENIIRRSKTLILNVKLLGADTSHAKDMLDNAKNSLENGDYNNAIEFAKKSMVEVMELKKKIENGEIQPAIPDTRSPAQTTTQSSSPVNDQIEQPMDVDDSQPVQNMNEADPVQQEPTQETPEVENESQKTVPGTSKQVVTEDILKNFEDSFSYLIEENRANNCFNIISNLIQDGYKGLCICRTNPNIIKRKYQLSDEDSTVLWLTDRDTSKEATISPSLESMIYVVEEFIDKNEQSIILLDGLEYLISNNSFNPVLRFIRRLIDKISETTSMLLIAVSPKAINEQELKLLERELNPIFIT